MRKDDEIRLRHMLDAAREAVAFARGRTRGDLDNDRQLVLALVKDVEIVGEAATQITEPTRQHFRRYRGSGSSGCVIDSYMRISTSTSISSGKRYKETCRN